MQRLFVDMDGTLAVFQPVTKLETLYEQGYFFDLKPNTNVVEAIRNITTNQEVEVYILSSVLSDSEYALEEKNAWLDKYLPEISRDHRIFPPCGQDKKDYIPDSIRRNDYLLDDYTTNLLLWQPPARGIKLLNGINHSSGTWRYDRIRYDKTAGIIEKDILSVMQGQQHIFDSKPEAHNETLPRNDILDFRNALQGISYNDWIDVTELYSEEAHQAALQNQKFMAREYTAQINDTFSLIKHSLVQGLVDSQGNTIECSTIDEQFFVQNDLLGKRDNLNHAETRSSNILISAHNFGDIETHTKSCEHEIYDEEVCR